MYRKDKLKQWKQKKMGKQRKWILRSQFI
jgi:hypothetical protein